MALRTVRGELSLEELGAPVLLEEEGQRYGGKAVGLARLVQDAGGLWVPEGFAVSATREEVSAWPEVFREAFASRCAALLEGGEVAVRSSALGEDAQDQSFAGLFVSCLHLGDLDAVWDAVDRCIASGGQPRVLEYAGVQEAIPVGVVVQRMVSARAAGVLFTRDPLGKDPALVLEAVHGVGEGLVSGHLEPTRWRVYRAGTGALELRGGASEGDEAPLTEAQVTQLAEAAWALAARWQQDLDLEWAIDEAGRLCWLQARPITTGSAWHPPMVRSAVPGAQDGPVTVWANFNIRESLPDPLNPLGWSLWRDNMVPLVTSDTVGIDEKSASFESAQVMDLVDHRLYINLNAIVWQPRLRRMMPKMVAFLDKRAAQVLEELLAGELVPGRKVPRDGLWKGLMQGLRGLKTNLQKLGVLLHPGEAMVRLEEAAWQCRQRTPVEELDEAGLLRELRVLRLPETEVLRRGFRAAGIAVMLWFFADQQFAPWPKARALLAAGVENNPTTLISMGLEELVEQARPFASLFLEADDDVDALLSALEEAAQTREEVEAWLTSFGDFLARYGHRGPQELDLRVARWQEEPTMLLKLIIAGLRSPMDVSVATRIARLAAQREAAMEEALSRAPFWKRPLLRWLARKVVEMMPFREGAKHHLMQAFFRMREAALALGARLVTRSILQEVDEIFFLEVDEIELLLAGKTLALSPEAASLSAMLAQRREALAQAQRREAPDFLRSDGVPVEEALHPESTEGLLHGQGIGGATVQGRVKILEKPDPQGLQQGDILVVRFADPGWTPLFPLVSGLIMEVGGLMCHAAVIARELDLPAVFGVRQATQLLQQGERVTLDGDKGLVTLHRDATATEDGPDGH